MSNQCLFCMKWATTSCCTSCRQISRSSMFEALLTLLNKATIYDNYYDQIKTICQHIETVCLFLKKLTKIILNCRI